MRHKARTKQVLQCAHEHVQVEIDTLRQLFWKYDMVNVINKACKCAQNVTNT